jgi:hypothetical protein
MAVLNSKFDILRGWPNGSAVAIDVGMEALPAAPAVAHSFRAGTFVKLIDDPVTPGRAVAGSTLTGTSSVNAAKDQRVGSGLGGFGFIIEGLEETFVVMSKTLTVLVGGGFVARFHKEASMTLNAFGSASIPNGVDQFEDRAARAVGVVADPGAPIPIAAGQQVTIRDGILVPYFDDAESLDRPVGFVLGYDSNNETLDVLFH